MLGIEYPIISAGMGPALIGEETGAGPELVVAVSEAGGMGVLGGSGYTVDELQEAIREIKKLTGKPYGVDLLLPKSITGGAAGGAQKIPPTMTEIPISLVQKTLPKEHQKWIKEFMEELKLPKVEVTVRLNTTVVRPQESVQVCIEEKVPLFAAGLGDPGWMIEDAHKVGMTVLSITGNSKNARRMAKSGIDLLVAQGHEGGGHTGRIGTMALIPICIDVAAPVPVLGAGGIGDGRGVAAVLAMGCIGAWIGTRFLATTESGAIDVMKQKIIDSDDEGTRVSTAYTGKTLRASYNKFHDAWDESGLKSLSFPIQAMISSALMQAFIKDNRDEYVGGLAGQVSGIIHEIKPAKEVLEEIVAETVEILSKKLPESVEAK